MLDWRKNGNPKTCEGQGNPSGSVRSNDLSHAQRIGAETVSTDYNAPTSLRHPERVKRYAELIRNYKKLGIKSLSGNKLNLICNNRRFQGRLGDIEVSA